MRGQPIASTETAMRRKPKPELSDELSAGVIRRVSQVVLRSGET
jgi:hypothetical protein